LLLYHKKVIALLKKIYLHSPQMCKRATTAYTSGFFKSGFFLFSLQQFLLPPLSCIQNLQPVSLPPEAFDYLHLVLTCKFKSDFLMNPGSHWGYVRLSGEVFTLAVHREHFAHIALCLGSLGWDASSE